MKTTHLLMSLLLASGAYAQDLIVPAGSTLVFDTTGGGLVQVRNFEIQAGGLLRVVGPRPFSVAAANIIIDGTLDASGASSDGVGTLNTANQPEPGAPGQAGGGGGGIGSSQTTMSTVAGLPGLGSYNSVSPLGGGGFGGETSYSNLGKDSRRGAGGGGGRLASDQPVSNDPLDPNNLGLVGTDGMGGGATGLGATMSGGSAQGGRAGASLFNDGDATNDFWGMQRTGSMQMIFGEAGRPYPGRGGGAGGDAVNSDSFPLMPFTPFGDEKGAGGAGGGGLVMLLGRTLRMGPEGRIRVDGGAGGGGENFIFFDRVGGGSGGGSGGWVVMEALQFDLSQASDNSITAVGGRGGAGRNNMFNAVGAGGNGGPGVVQLHTRQGFESELMLPIGKALSDLTMPNGIVLLPILAP